MGFIGFKGYPQNFRKRTETKENYTTSPYSPVADLPEILDFYKQYGYPTNLNAMGAASKYMFKEAVLNWGKKYSVPQDVLDQWISWSTVNTAPSYEQKKTFWDKVKNTVNAAGVSIQNGAELAGTKVQTAVDNASQGLKNKISNAASSGSFAVLAPYKPLMILALKSKGHSVSNSDSIKDISLLFYQSVIQNRQSFDFRKQHLDPTDTSSLLVNPVDGSKNPVSPSQVKTIILQVVSYIKNVIDKKTAGQSLTPTEQVVYNQDQAASANYGVQVAKKKSGLFGLINGLQSFIANIFNSNKQSYQQEHLRRRITDRSKTNNSALGGTVVTATGVTIPTQLNDTETAYAVKAMNSQNLATKGVITSANDLNQNQRKPNSWFQDRWGTWHWIDNAGHMST